MKNFTDLRAWSEAINEYYGEIPAQQFAAGFEEYIGNIIEDVCTLREMSEGASVKDLPYSILSIHLPARFLEAITLPVVRKLSETANNLMERFVRGDLDINSVAEEIVLHGIATCGLTHFEIEADLEGKSIDNDYLDISWVYDVIGDEDVDIFLFDDGPDPIQITPDDEFYYFPENWFKNYYELPAEADIAALKEKYGS